MLIDLDFPDLRIEELPSGLLELQQDGFGGNETASVLIHRLHVKALAEQLGLLNTIEPQAAKKIVTLTRRVRVLHDYIDDITEWFLAPGRDYTEDMTAGIELAMGAWRMAFEFLADLDDPKGGFEPPSAATKPPESGGVEGTQKRGPSTAAQPMDNTCTSDGEAVPKAAPLGKDGTASPKSNAERQKAFRDRRRNDRNAAPVTPHADQLEIPNDD